MTDVLDRYEALHLEATAGRVRWEVDTAPDDYVALVSDGPRVMRATGMNTAGWIIIDNPADARLIAASRNTVPAVIALAQSIGRSRGEIEELIERAVEQEPPDTSAVVALTLIINRFDAFLSALSEEVK